MIVLDLKAVFLVTTLAGVAGLWPAILADTRSHGHRHHERAAPTAASLS